MSGHVDVLALIAEVEKRLGEVRTQVHGQHEDETARAREVGRLRGEIGILEDERSRLLSRQLSLESQLAEARASESDAHAEIDRVKRETLRDLERMAAEARDARAALSTEMTLEFERRAAESARRLAELERATAATVEEQSTCVHELAAELASTRSALADAEARLATVSAERDAIVAELSSAKAEITSVHAELAASQTDRAAIAAELRAQSEELARHSDELESLSATSRELASNHDIACAERAQRDAEIDGLSREIDGLRQERAALAERLAEAESSVRSAEESAARAREEARLALESQASANSSAPIAAPVDEEEIARVAEARIQQIMAPKVAQLAQAAAFLRKRKERLAAVRAGLRRKAQAMRILRQIYAQPRLDAGLPMGAAADSVADAPVVASAGTTQALEAAPNGASVDAGIAAERAELERERRELVDLRAIVSASERALERRAHGTRVVTSAALVVAMLGVAGAASWHIAGAIAPDRVRASVELDVSSRTPEAKREGAIDAKPIGDELTHALADEAFVGAVASRLVERGRSREEAAGLVAGLSERASVSAEGAVVRVVLSGEGADATVAALDAVASSTVAELNRRPERRSDMLRVGIANARQEVGRTVFSKAESIADLTRLWRAGTILGAFAALAAAAALTMAWLARRAARADVV